MYVVLILFFVSVRGIKHCGNRNEQFTCAGEFCFLWYSVSGVNEADFGMGLGEPQSPSVLWGWVVGLEQSLLEFVGVLSATLMRGAEALKLLKRGIWAD